MSEVDVQTLEKAPATLRRLLEGFDEGKQPTGSPIWGDQ